MTKRIEIHLRRAKNLALAIFLLFGVPGCAFSTYKAHSPNGIVKPDNYPVPAYTEQMKIPRPVELMGTVTFHAGKFTMFGGDPEKELAKILQMARQKGADAVRVNEVEKPDFGNPNYRLTAQLLRYADIWEVAPFTRKTFQAYLNSHRAQLDPIEGIWLSDILHGLTIGIVRNNSTPGRDFVGFILNSSNPAWTVGMKKIDIYRGPQPGSYVLNYYMDDFARREVPVILNKDQFAISIYTGEFSDNQETVTYTKFQ